MAADVAAAHVDEIQIARGYTEAETWVAFGDVVEVHGLGVADSAPGFGIDGDEDRYTPEWIDELLRGRSNPH